MLNSVRPPPLVRVRKLESGRLCMILPYDMTEEYFDNRDLLLDRLHELTEMADGPFRDLVLDFPGAAKEDKAKARIDACGARTNYLGFS